tara:strand:+ start:3965 stop:4435 length:471 start_codon:yes stop_codon:yes gene_type:complete
MKKMVEIYSTGNEYYYFLDGKKRGGFSTKEKAKADAKEMNRARKAGGQKKLVTGKAENINTGPIQQGETKLSDAKRERLKKSEWFDLLKKDPRRAKKARKKRKKGKKKSSARAKDPACYDKVKAKYTQDGGTWPSAYGSGALVQCRKVGAANWGKK